MLADLVPIERSIHTVNDRWLTTRPRPYRTTDDKVECEVVTFFDVTERRKADAAWAARQEQLLQEFGHRFKNALAVVQSIVRQTLSSCDGCAVESALSERLTDRLQSLALSHELLLRREWKDVDLDQLVREPLAAHMDGSRSST